MTIRVRAPATSANLGPGFDCLGMALDLWNEVSATPGGGSDPENLILRAAARVYDEVGQAYPGFDLRSTNRVPFGRGLGSSAAAIACGVLLANDYLGSPLDQAGCLKLATALEGHPDNVVPCFLGGIRVATRDDAGRVVQCAVPLGTPLAAVVYVPDQPIATAHARGLLPDTIPRADALFNVARASLLVAALASGRPDLLAEATRDKLHQPYRQPLFPSSATLVQAAMQAGALGAFSSGAGPSVLALCGADADRAAIAAAFEQTASSAGVAGSVLCLDLSVRGAHVVD